MRLPDPMTHDLGLGSDFSDPSTSGSESVVKRDKRPGGWVRASAMTGTLGLGAGAALRRRHRHPDRLMTIGEACRAMLKESLRKTLTWAIEQVTERGPSTGSLHN